MAGQFPGIKTQDYFDEDMHRLLDKKANNISIVSCVANSKDSENRENRSFVQGLEKLVFAMQGERYTAVILANATSQRQVMRSGKAMNRSIPSWCPLPKAR